MAAKMLKTVFSNPKSPGSFGGIDALYRALKGKVTRREIKEWLKGENAYTLHKPVRRHFKKNRVIVSSIDEQFQADLADMGNLSAENDGYRYILTCIDVFSKYAWALPIKRKTGAEMVAAFKMIFSERKPTVLQSDSGKEFKNEPFQKFLKQEGVHFFTTFNQTKASVVERFNRTLKTKMWKYFTEVNTRKYIDVLPDLMSSYNHTYHRSIRMEPAKVNNRNETEVWHHLYGDMVHQKPRYKFKVGDLVRISKAKLMFEKGYETNWTEEYFVISQRRDRSPPVYKVKDLLNDEIHGTFYEAELQKVKRSETFPVEKILKKRQRKKKVEYWVKFKGYPDKFNAWVTSDDLFKI